MLLTLLNMLLLLSTLCALGLDIDLKSAVSRCCSLWAIVLLLLLLVVPPLTKLQGALLQCTVTPLPAVAAAVAFDDVAPLLLLLLQCALL